MAVPPTRDGLGDRLPCRIGLADLMTWVLGAGILASAWREVRPWTWLAPRVDVDRLLGFSAASLAVLLGIGLLRQAFVLIRRRRTMGDRTLLAALGWRAAVVVLLGLSLAVESRLLSPELPVVAPDDSPEALRGLLPLCLTLGMVGIVAGLTPGRAGGGPGRMGWVSVIGAASVGTMIAATQTLLPYLILFALEAVSNAMTRVEPSRRAWHGVQRRIAEAGLEVAPALVCCLALALLLSRELRRPAAPSGESGGTWRGTLALPAATVAAALAAAWLVLVTVPRLHVSLASGVRSVITPASLAVLAFGLGGLASGIVSRGADRRARGVANGPGEHPGSSWPAALMELAIALPMLVLMLARGFDLAGRFEGSAMRRIGWVDAAFERLGSILPPLGVDRSMAGFSDLEWVVLVIAQVWAFRRIVPLLLMPVDDEPGPLDASLGGRRGLGRLSMRWFALTTLMVALLPTFFVAGLFFLDAFFTALG